MTLPSQATVGSSNILAALILFAFAILAKYVVETSRKQLAMTGPGSYIYESRVVSSRKRRAAYKIYRWSFRLRPILVLVLLAYPAVGGALLAVSLVAEMYVLFRYHLVLMTALGLFLAIQGAAVVDWSTFNLGVHAHYRAPALPFLQVLVAAMYGLSAVRKWRNGFANGHVLLYGLEISLSQRKHADHVPGSIPLIKFAGRFTNWRIMAKGVIGVELLVGCLLVAPNHTLNTVGVALAAVSQLSFTVLFPRTLLSFTLAVYASLVLWL